MLARHGVEHRLLDANIEGLLHLIGMPVPLEKADDVWTRRAVRNRKANLSAMRDPVLYLNMDRYKRRVRDISRVLGRVSQHGATVGLVNRGHEGLSPLRSRDLLLAAERPEMDPFYPYFRPRLEDLFRQKNPETVGVSLAYLSQALSAFAIMGFIKKTYPGVRIILGGGLITSWMSNPLWKDPFAGLADQLVAGPGEDSLLSLLGLGAERKSNPRPDYLSLPLGQYLSPGFILPYNASSGCYWNRCRFCPEKAEDNPYRQIPAKQAISDLRALASETEPALIHLLDNAISPALLEAISREGFGVPWYGFGRIGPHLVDPDFCAALKRAGCVMLKLGIESGDQRVLDAMDKGISVGAASTVLRNLKNAGIATYVYLIFGTPAETEAGARKTLEFTVQHGDSIDFLNLAIFNMPACGTQGEIIRRSFYEGDLSLYTDFVHPAGWDRRRVRLFLEREFRRHPAISPKLNGDPPLFTSNHAPFFVMGRQNAPR